MGGQHTGRHRGGQSSAQSGDSAYAGRRCAYALGNGIRNGHVEGKKAWQKVGQRQKGDGNLKRMSVILLAVVVVLSTLLMSAHAGPPTTATGLWQYKPSILSEMRYCALVRPLTS